MNGGKEESVTRFCLVQDSDCHWYVIPTDQQEDFDLWDGSPEAEDGIVPDYATEVGGSPTLVTFPSFTIG